jgi:hypothetical protein
MVGEGEAPGSPQRDRMPTHKMKTLCEESQPNRPALAAKNLQPAATGLAKEAGQGTGVLGSGIEAGKDREEENCASDNQRVKVPRVHITENAGPGLPSSPAPNGHWQEATEDHGPDGTPEDHHHSGARKSCPFTGASSPCQSFFLAKLSATQTSSNTDMKTDRSFLKDTPQGSSLIESSEASDMIVEPAEQEGISRVDGTVPVESAQESLAGAEPEKTRRAPTLSKHFYEQITQSAMANKDVTSFQRLPLEMQYNIWNKVKESERNSGAVGEGIKYLCELDANEAERMKFLSSQWMQARNKFTSKQACAGSDSAPAGGDGPGSSHDEPGTSFTTKTSETDADVE